MAKRNIILGTFSKSNEEFRKSEAEKKLLKKLKKAQAPFNNRIIFRSVVELHSDRSRY